MKNVVLVVSCALAINLVDGQTNQANAIGIATTSCGTAPPTYVTGALFPGNGCEHKVVWFSADWVTYQFSGSWNCIAPGGCVSPPPWTKKSGVLWQSSGSDKFNHWLGSACGPPGTIITTQTWQNSSITVAVEHPYIDGRYNFNTTKDSGYNTSNITVSGPCGGGSSASTGDTGL